MYGNVLLNSGRIIGSISGSKIVDDERNVTIQAVQPEGRAAFLALGYPDRFTPGVEFEIIAVVKNDDDAPGPAYIFVRLRDSDTGNILWDETTPVIIPQGVLIPPSVSTIKLTLTQTTDFHGIVEIGHTT
jgi:hypothetical protein